MPTYEYVCTNPSCQNAWEEIQKISEDALTVCPKCSQSTAKRQISGGNFILKGGGWYADLYSSAKPSSSTSSDSKGESSSGSSSSGSGDNKSGSGDKPAEKKQSAAPPANTGSGSSGSSGSGSSGSGSSS